MNWEDVIDVVAAWEARVAVPAWEMKRAAADVYTTSDIGYYMHPETTQVALYGAGSRTDQVLCKEAAEAVFNGAVRPLFLSDQELAEPAACWIKIAYSPTLRRVGELLNFFPGQYPGGLPNAPSPLAATLTSGVVGAGLGYGLGRLGGAILPEGYGDNLGRTGAILGGLAGTGLGGTWAASNLANHKSFTSGEPLDASPDSPPAPEPEAQWPYGTNPVTAKQLKTAEEALAAIPLPAWWEQAVRKAAALYGDTFAMPYSPRASTPLDVNVNAMGQLLWDTGASPQLAATTMGALYAAHQLPDPESRPGVVTGNQLGQLAMGAAGDYVTGLLVGKALNLAVGLPVSARTMGLGAAALGIVGSVVPKLLGR